MLSSGLPLEADLAAQIQLLDRIAGELLAGRMTEAQAQGFAFLVDRWQGSGEPPVLAYVLATAFHETGGLMQPVRERGDRTYLLQRYDVTGTNPGRARSNGNDRPGDGVRYAGRGYVQITWKANYERVGRLLGVDLVTEPDRALEPDIAAAILIYGMTKGWFTGRKTSDYIGGGRLDFRGARRVVNGLDRSALIAGHAKAILRALGHDSVSRLSVHAATRLQPPAVQRPPPLARP